jgi:hypothetical protein
VGIEILRPNEIRDRTANDFLGAIAKHLRGSLVDVGYDAFAIHHGHALSRGFHDTPIALLALPQRLCGAVAFRDVPDQAEHADDLALGVAQRRDGVLRFSTW